MLGHDCILRAMRRAVLPLPLAPVVVAAAALLGACRGGGGAPAPDAEFVVAAGDTSVWVRASASGVELQRAPIMLARLDGRLHQLYVTEDDFSFYDAVLVSQAVWRRDLVTGDSLLVFADTVAAAAARRWVAAHPDDRLLEPDEPEADEPRVTAIVEAALLDVHGPYAAIESFTDLHDERGESHRTRRLVVDLRSGRVVPLAALVGDDAARDAVAGARAGFQRLRDSTLAQVATRDEDQAARALRRFVFDPASFAIAADGERPGVVFYVSGEGGEEDGYALPLAPVTVPAGDWWRAARAELPAADRGTPPLPLADEQGADRAGRVLRWPRPAFELLARYDSTGESAVLALRDRGGREHALGRVTAPVQRVLWLDDAPRLGDDARRALRQAFRDAAAEGSGYRQAALHRDHPRGEAGARRVAAPARGGRRAPASAPHVPAPSS